MKSLAAPARGDQADEALKRSTLAVLELRLENAQLRKQLRRVRIVLGGVTRRLAALERTGGAGRERQKVAL